MAVCVIAGCPALAVEGFARCTIHLCFGRREKGDAVISCYACGARFRIGARYLVKSEGVFHLRPSCSRRDPAHCYTTVLPAATPLEASA